MHRQLPISFISTAIFATLFLAGTATGNSTHRRRSAVKSNAFLDGACNVTLYPSLCYTSLQPYVHIFKTNQRELAVVAGSISLTNATNATRVLSELRDKTPRDELMALNECVSLLTDASGLIRDSIKELRNLTGKTRESQLGNVKTWMSAALTNENTCMDGFQGLDGKVKDAVDEKIGMVKMVTSNALALVNWFADSVRS